MDPDNPAAYRRPPSLASIEENLQRQLRREAKAHAREQKRLAVLASRTPPLPGMPPPPPKPPINRREKPTP